MEQRRSTSQGARWRICINTSVNPRISNLVLDEAEGSDAELSGAVAASLNSFFE